MNARLVPQGDKSDYDEQHDGLSITQELALGTGVGAGNITQPAVHDERTAGTFFQPGPAVKHDGQLGVADELGRLFTVQSLNPFGGPNELQMQPEHYKNKYKSTPKNVQPLGQQLSAVSKRLDPSAPSERVLDNANSIYGHDGQIKKSKVSGAAPKDAKSSTGAMSYWYNELFGSSAQVDAQNQRAVTAEVRGAPTDTEWHDSVPSMAEFRRTVPGITREDDGAAISDVLAPGSRSTAPGVLVGREQYPSVWRELKSDLNTIFVDQNAAIYRTTNMTAAQQFTSTKAPKLVRSGVDDPIAHYGPSATVDNHHEQQGVPAR